MLHPNLRSWRGTISALSCVLALFCSSDQAFAQHADPQRENDPWTVARDAYKEQDWAAARRYTAAASQRDPKEPRYYLSLARIAFQQGAYEDAVWFYDVFIEYARQASLNYRGTYALDRAEAERKSANTRRKNPDHAPQEPEAQVRVRNALLARLKEGAVVREDGGGARATFESLMRMGYANPDFEQLYATLSEAAGVEADRLLESGHGRIPALSYVQWKHQVERYETSYALVPPPIPFDGAPSTSLPPETSGPAPRAKAYQRFSEAQRQYLLQNWSVAARLFQEAIDMQPSFHLAHQGLLNALLATSAPDSGALKSAYDQFETHSAKSPYLSIYKALTKAAMRDTHAASLQLIEILTDNRTDL